MDEPADNPERVGSDAPSQLLTDAADEHRSRGAMRLVMRALRAGWDIDKTALKDLPGIAVAIARAGESETVKLRAIELVASLRMDNLTTVEKLDKIDRLDAGEATENIGHKHTFPDLEF